MANPGLSAMRPVVEKELLHYEIFQALDAEGLLKNLVFQGGTSLRLCRGSDRFSEDLDFAGGVNFSSESMQKIKECIEKRIGERFGLQVLFNNKPAKVGQGVIKHVRVDKWWLSIQTSPENPAMPRQKIKLEIANIPAYTRELVPLKVNYEVLGCMPTVIVNAESLDEIMADKILAFPTSLLDNEGRQVGLDSAKIWHRDIWDLAWMASRQAKLVPKLVVIKIKDYGVVDYLVLLECAIQQIPQIVKSPEFKDQMRRFIDSSTVAKTLDVVGYDDYLASSVSSLFRQMQIALNAMPVVVATQPVIRAAEHQTIVEEGQAQAGFRR
ncbi:nucleotidyl transferase AbiEii/AbiGii toxin family protein [Herbaspirillum sp. RTI4]|uniref:nucleotidyl transferase AbiEii/AbiGii toxin family protein n=1 Tax=Herbaspirillum sp. RTI4 TaxID=3048640 RepID=UPI002AB5CF8C|nr:nucleotidyl transferase AbiEii/AbiGii toxin family protein [Herbaspirillum sp. RTI4]MDY7579934.1 nucleotidyl transferase AbiEii/AbiGii toxin family protein [Herbaspirillum sp. RTI4]MEA9983542.1 nucleotidyl transferase AbiEii/AbiGii toxin family protein [Herbaspirillum sp. RTI4]